MTIPAEIRRSYHFCEHNAHTTQENGVRAPHIVCIQCNGSATAPIHTPNMALKVTY